MATKTKVKFNAKAWGKSVLDMLVKTNTDRLIAYAEKRIQIIGASIEGYNSRNHMDRTGNLLDSLCWFVLYNGGLKKYGLYRSPEAVEESHLHEWSKPMGESVNGHVRALSFIKSYTPTTTSGWEVVFAVLAPYWGYWEKGHVNVRSGQVQKWQVMTQQYDVVTQDLAPMKVTFHNYVP